MNSMNLNLQTIFKPLRPLIHVKCKIEMKVKFVLLQAIKLLFWTFHCAPNLVLKDFQVWSIEKEVDYLQI